ncbi:uncharacterized protein BP5553_02996 [Venustampulla echinocandica]|uniref:Uncharacterized protein n=1 Tax=Venustampulla echinocandica TaxID=2656787 RepID=A0A370TSZ9_9HELO|nr:uncharacterized protein BP5553_02996 [Venustampulla echinocandica]RDL38656.1 hypothetical protein BP5553_02996 [Venustampulla echinocandica]
MGSNGIIPEMRKIWRLGDKFEARMPHHDGIKALWETKWKFPNNINDGYGDAYTEAFFPTAEKLTQQGDELAKYKNLTSASELYLRAACLYRIARFPYITMSPVVNSPIKWTAWEAQKEVYMKAGGLWEDKVEEVVVPFLDKAGRDRDEIPVYVRIPNTGIKEGRKAPVVVLFTGLDGYRPDNTQRTEEFLRRGWACVVVEIPGTADCPADPSDPTSPDRLWTSLLNWMATEECFDMEKVMVWGLSCGGYYAVRIAHTHKDRLRGVIAQGAGTHYFFTKEWLEKVDGHEYPFLLGPAISLKHGYDSFDEYKEKALKKFSLLENGILQKPSTRLLLINGLDDGLMPIEDSLLPFEYGTPKEARFFPNALHMGYPMANGSVYPWMESVMVG